MADTNSRTAAEALLVEIARRLRGDKSPGTEVEVLDANVRAHGGGWRLICWVRFDNNIHTLVLHQASVVDVVPDAPVPPLPGVGQGG